MIINWHDKFGIYDSYQYGYLSNVITSNFLRKVSCHILHQMTLNAGDKIKVVARVFSGTPSETASDSVRLRIQKLYST